MINRLVFHVGDSNSIETRFFQCIYVNKSQVVSSFVCLATPLRLSAFLDNLHTGNTSQRHNLKPMWPRLCHIAILFASKTHQPWCSFAGWAACLSLTGPCLTSSQCLDCLAAWCACRAELFACFCQHTGDTHKVFASWITFKLLQFCKNCSCKWWRSLRC